MGSDLMLPEPPTLEGRAAVSLGIGLGIGQTRLLPVDGVLLDADSDYLIDGDGDYLTPAA